MTKETTIRVVENLYEERKKRKEDRACKKLVNKRARKTLE